MCLKHLGLADFPITNIGICSSRALEAAITVNRAFLCFPPEQCLPRKCKNFNGSASQNRPNSSALKISFSSCLANNIGKIVSSHYAVITLVTFSDSPETSLKVMSCWKKMINALVSLILFWLELQTKVQGKYHLSFLPNCQPSVRWCKMFAIECFSNKSFLEENRTADGNVVITH